MNQSCIIVSRSGELIHMPEITQAQRNAMWRALVKIAAPGAIKKCLEEREEKENE